MHYITISYQIIVLIYFQLSVEYVNTSAFLLKKFEMYVSRADCIPISGDKDSFVLKEGQFVEVLDSAHPGKWLVRTKPTKATPARQGWLCPAYLEKKRKVMARSQKKIKHNAFKKKKNQ